MTDAGEEKKGAEAVVPSESGKLYQKETLFFFTPTFEKRKRRRRHQNKLATLLTTKTKTGALIKSQTLATSTSYRFFV